MFQVVRQVDNTGININNIRTTKHMIDRLYRVQFNKTYLNNDNIYKVYLIDTNHSNGLELHVLLKDATILIINDRTKKLITILNARKNQLLRYDRNVPVSMIRKALRNERLKKNY